MQNRELVGTQLLRRLVGQDDTLEAGDVRSGSEQRGVDPRPPRILQVDHLDRDAGPRQDRAQCLDRRGSVGDDEHPQLHPRRLRVGGRRREQRYEEQGDDEYEPHEESMTDHVTR